MEPFCNQCGRDVEQAPHAEDCGNKSHARLSGTLDSYLTCMGKKKCTECNEMIGERPFTEVYKRRNGQQVTSWEHIRVAHLACLL